MRSIIQSDKTRCFLCGSSAEALDEHHVFGGKNRKLSEKYGLKIYLCHARCHIFGSQSVHANAAVNRAVQEAVQKMAMEHYGWTTDDFRRVFGKSYISC